jgi:predicted phosphodiesterase
MRILHISDLHMNKRWFDWVAANARRFDACCLSGDLLDMFTFDQLQSSEKTQTSWALRWLATFPGRLFVCSGNHDYLIGEGAAWLQAARSSNVSVDGDSAALGDWNVFCKPWEGEVIPRGELVVLLAHAPPERLEVSTDGAGDHGSFETSDITGSLPPGSVVLSGHVHRPQSWHSNLGRVLCLNPGFGDPRSAVPNHTVVDLSKRRVTFHGWGADHGPIRF